MAPEHNVYTVFTFVSTHQALKAEKVLKEEALKASIIPVPREISSLCGLAIRVDAQQRGQVEQTLRGKGVGIEAVFDFVPRTK
ncbi:MAG: DUF3343 domain-containing protein [Syntrophomonadaceae bacterium]|nr:DUF3343 domain-containing protein [Syntrophomonadaceae bacterium]